MASQFIPPKLDFDPVNDFRPLVIGMFQPVLLIVRPSLGVRSVDEFVAYAKRNPGKISFGVQGIGGEMHLTLEHFKKIAGVDITHVPYNSGAQAIIDLLADRPTPCSWSSRRSSSTSRAASSGRLRRSTKTGAGAAEHPNHCGLGGRK